MKKEDKELLLKVLCAMLPYGVKVQIIDDLKFSDTTNPYDAWLSLELLQKYGNWCLYKPFIIKPYLRPMSSMTKEERDLMVKLHIDERIVREIEICDANCIDFYNSHHLDYRGLIPMGLALEAPEDMYKTE